MINIVFFGTPLIALKSLEYLFDSEKINILAVVTQPDKPSGRGHKMTMSPIKKFALEHDLQVFQPKSIRKEPDVIEELKKLNPDFFVTFAFGQILSQEVLDIPEYETINLHASLLPKYRGANPIQRVLIDGELETGICTMITELGVDCGDICKQQIIQISENMNCENLYEEISEDAPKLIEATLIEMYEKKLCPIPQFKNGICIAPKVAKEETKIDWNKSAKQLHNLVRGIYKSPSAYFVYENKIIKVLETRTVDYRRPMEFYEDYELGSIVGTTKDGIEILTGEGILKILVVKPEGKGEMQATAWYNGIRNRKVH